MGASPSWKVYTAAGEYIAACKYPSDAAAVVGLSNSGTVKWCHKLVVWREGQETVGASRNYDEAAEIMLLRLREAYPLSTPRRS